MKIAIGVVEHGSSHTPSRHLNADFDVHRLVNADRASRTSWSGFGENHNSLMSRSADADWYIALNPDVWASPQAIRRLIEHAELAELTIAAPLFECPWGVSGEPQAAFPSPQIWLNEAAGRDERIGDNGPVAQSEWVCGACMAINRRRAPDLRFDPRYFMYFEDVDLCLRAKRAGGRVGVVRSVTVQHDSGWSASDPLRWRRGVEFARSALLFADVAGYSNAAMRWAGLSRFGSRVLLGRTPQSRTGAQAITRGFLAPRRPGLRELAADFNHALS
jgi:GT2 family glycosyltransferase